MEGHQGGRDDATDGEGREDGRQIVGMGGVKRLKQSLEFRRRQFRHLHMLVAAVLLTSVAGGRTFLKALTFW